MRKSYSLNVEQFSEKIELPVIGKKSSLEESIKFNIFKTAKNMIGNFTNLVQKKEEFSKSDKPELPTIEDKLSKVHENSEKSSDNRS